MDNFASLPALESKSDIHASLVSFYKLGNCFVNALGVKITFLLTNWSTLDVLDISKFPFASVSKRAFVQNLSYENEFDLQENELLGGTRFHMNCFALRLVLTQRQKATRK